MYREFYQLNTKPFQISSDPAFLWLGEKHKEALATLKYGILDNKGFLLLTGDVGTGKTTLINTLIQSLGNDVICTSVPDPNLNRLDFYNYIAGAFGITQEFKSKGTFLVRFSHFLHTTHAQGKKVLLIIDESQLLTQELLEEVRLLSNIEKAETKLLNIFFVGQNEFNEILSRPQNRAVRQRLTLNYNIDPLTSDETGEYITHRLRVAGTEKKLFLPDAVREIHRYSQGFPRRINVLCDHALLTGYVRDCREISAGVIRECAKELNIPVELKTGSSSRGDLRGESRFQNRSNGSPPPEIFHSGDEEGPWGDDPASGAMDGHWVQESESRAGNVRWVKRPVSEAGNGRGHSHPLPGAGGKMGAREERRQQNFDEHGVERAAGRGDAGSSRLSIWAGRIALLFLLALACFYLFPEWKAPVVNGIRNIVYAVQDAVGEIAGQNRETDNTVTKPVTTHAVPSPIDHSLAPLADKDDLKDSPSPEPESLPGSSSPPYPRNEDGESPPAEAAESPNSNGSDSMSEAAALSSSPPFPKKIETPALDAVSISESAVVPQLPSSLKAQTHKKVPPLPAGPVVVRFRYNSNDFSEKGLNVLETFAGILVHHPEAQVKVTGYTDSAGNDMYNRKLSEFRANIVRSYLLGKGASPDQITSTGLGSKNPVESNDTARGRKMNRRVEIEVVAPVAVQPEREGSEKSLETTAQE